MKFVAKFNEDQQTIKRKRLRAKNAQKIEFIRAHNQMERKTERKAPVIGEAYWALSDPS